MLVRFRILRFENVRRSSHDYYTATRKAETYGTHLEFPRELPILARWVPACSRRDSSTGLRQPSSPRVSLARTRRPRGCSLVDRPAEAIQFTTTCSLPGSSPRRTRSSQRHCLPSRRSSQKSASTIRRRSWVDGSLLQHLELIRSFASQSAFATVSHQRYHRSHRAAADQLARRECPRGPAAAGASRHPRTDRCGAHSRRSRSGGARRPGITGGPKGTCRLSWGASSRSCRLAGRRSSSRQTSHQPRSPVDVGDRASSGLDRDMELLAPFIVLLIIVRGFGELSGWFGIADSLVDFLAFGVAALLIPATSQLDANAEAGP